MIDLASLADMPIEVGAKGFPNGLTRMRLEEVGRAGWRLHEDLVLPAAVLRRSALEANSRWMRAFISHFAVDLCPHGKTTMAPQLFDLQLRDGCWGMTCATLAHLKVYRRFGIKRVIFANQLPTPASAAWLVEELARAPEFDVHVFIDSWEGAVLLADAAAAAGLTRPIKVLLELGMEGVRTGVRGVEAALALGLRLATLAPRLCVSGVATFEGVIPGADGAEIEAAVEALFADVVELAQAADAEGVFTGDDPVVLTAGGSKYYDLAALRLSAARLRTGAHVVLRSGCYISHDAIEYDQAFDRMRTRSAEVDVPGRLENALEVWGVVQSRPEAQLALVNLGKRDISFDHGLPQVIATAPGRALDLNGFEVIALSDQHVHVRVPAASDLRIGDHLGFGVSHPCTTFDKWRFLFVVDDKDRVTGAVATFF